MEESVFKYIRSQIEIDVDNIKQKLQDEPAIKEDDENEVLHKSN